MPTTHLTDTSFSSLPIHPMVLKALEEANLTQCTPIQEMSLPQLLSAHDVAGQAQTGTGKTIAFLVATFHYLLSNVKESTKHGPKAIIMAPTRELAVQIYNDAQLLSKHTDLSVGVVYGGEGYETQRETLNKGVDILIGTCGRESTPETKTNSRISEELFYPSNEDKPVLLLTLMEEEWPDKAIVFANTKHDCEWITGWLEGDGHRVGLLSGDVQQKKRLSILEDFTAGNLDILVATDVAARGLHIDKVTHVFNYDLADDAEDYVHRIGRTGRAGELGKAISFACEKYAQNLTAIELYIGHDIPVTDYNPLFLLEDVKPPKMRARSTRGRPSGGKGGGQRSARGPRKDGARRRPARKPQT